MSTGARLARLPNPSQYSRPPERRFAWLREIRGPLLPPQSLGYNTEVLQKWVDSAVLWFFSVGYDLILLVMKLRKRPESPDDQRAQC